MPDQTSPSASVPNPVHWDESLIFAVLNDESRRQLLRTIALGTIEPASQLKTRVGLRLHGTVKHLTLMREAGLVTMENDPADGRRQLYRLSPNVPLTKTDQGAVIDFGFVLLRL
jgi:predicted transcriptional regulator